MGLGIAIFAVVIIIGVLIGLNQAKANKQLLEDGRILARNMSFIQEREIFKLKNADYKTVLNKMNQTIHNFDGIGADIDAFNSEARITFKAKDWSAVLLGFEPEDDLYTYSFNFTGWQGRNGVPYQLTAMNVTLTAVEKLFLAIDPDTQVTTERIKTKTKTSLF